MTDTAKRPATDARLHTMFTKGHPTTFTLTQYPDALIASLALPDGTIASVKADSVEDAISALFGTVASQFCPDGDGEEWE